MQINKGAEQNKTRKELDVISEKVKASRLQIKDLLVPISVAIILIILGIFVFVPMIKSAINFRIEYKEIKDKEEKLESLEKELRKIDEGIFQVDLINAKQVIPRTLRVSSFMYYIDTLANEKNLVSKSLTAGDTQITVTDNENNKKEKKSYLGVNGPLSYNGTLNNILDFLDTLYSASPYIISAENISLKKSSSDEWKVTLSVTGYYVPENSDKVDLYDTFVMYTQNQDVVDIFATKAEKLK